MIVVSLGGILNDEVEYELSLERPFSQPSLKLERTVRTSGDPLISAASREPLTMVIYARVLGGNDEALTAELREEALAAWDSDTAAIELVVTDDDGGNERYRDVVVQAVDEEMSEQGPGQYFILSAVTHGETRWRSTTRQTVTWEVEASEDTLAVDNPGSLPARPTYTFKPTVAKSGAGNAFSYRMFCPCPWEGRTVNRYPYDVTHSKWDTAALVDENVFYVPYGTNNIGLVVDGRMTRRWVTGYGGFPTQVWANLDWDAYSYSFLRTSIGSGDTVERIEAGSDISTYPREGILMIGDEIFTYTDRDDGRRWFLGVTRAAKDSTAAAHAGGEYIGDKIYWIQHDIWIVYGGTGYWLNSYDDFSGFDPGELVGTLEDVGRPMFHLGSGSNQIWNFQEFAEQIGEDEGGQRYLANRSASWRPFGGEGLTASGNPYEALTVSNTGFGSSSGWRLEIAYYIEFVQFAGEAQNFTPGGSWEAGLYYPNLDGSSISHLPIPDPIGSDVPVSFSLHTENDVWMNEWLHFEQRSVGAAMMATMTDLTVVFKDVPTAELMPQTTMYDMRLTLENVTTGESIQLVLPMALNEQLEVNTAEHTVTLLDTGSSQYQAIAKSSRRRDMLPLGPGMNTLRIEEDGLQGMTVTISFETRRYS